jgi:hypothetical protein
LDKLALSFCFSCSRFPSCFGSCLSIDFCLVLSFSWAFLVLADFCLRTGTTTLVLQPNNGLTGLRSVPVKLQAPPKPTQLTLEQQEGISRLLSFAPSQASVEVSDTVRRLHHELLSKIAEDKASLISRIRVPLNNSRVVVYTRDIPSTIDLLLTLFEETDVHRHIELVLDKAASLTTDKAASLTTDKAASLPS